MKYGVLIAILLLLALAACSPGVEGETMQEDAIDVADAAANDPSQVEEEVEDVMDYIPSPETSDGDFEGFGMSYVVDGETFSFDTAQVMAQTPVPEFHTIIAPDATGIQLRTLQNEVGTYTIGEGPSSYRVVNVWFTHEGVRYDADASKGSGTITLDSVGTVNGADYEGAMTGTFEGTFVANDGSEIEVTDGVFNADGMTWG